MKTIYDLSDLEWKLTGWLPYAWEMDGRSEISDSPSAEITAVPARVPGSVQQALREAGVIPDWNLGLNHRLCEWVENRHWVYETRLPDDWITPGKRIRLRCLGLDSPGWVILNGEHVGGFDNTHLPYEFDITGQLAESRNVLRIIFDTPQRWLGQSGRTSQMREPKPRFNYSWDWTARLVQIGIWDGVFLEVTDGPEIAKFACYTDVDASTRKGKLVASGRVEFGPGGSPVVRLTISREGAEVASRTACAEEFNAVGVELSGFEVDLWWPNMEGDQPLYDLVVEMLDRSGKTLDRLARRIGFREVRWEPCQGAPPEADPWICVVNGRPVFLQGVNWTPIRPNFADVAESDYRKRLEVYKDLGINILRVWGGAVLEREVFYDICDELGLMVWQEFPLSSSSIDSLPPHDHAFVDSLAAIAESFIERRQGHASLIQWCGGNELMRQQGRVPLDISHPLLARLEEVVERLDPTRRFLPTSPCGPRVFATFEEYGKGVHWDVHGPWKAGGDLDQHWTNFWRGDDALFHAETGAPGASSVQIIRAFAGDCEVMPVSVENPFWRRNSTWWIETDEFVREMGREPQTPEEYVEWSQARQSKALSIVMRSAKSRFPGCGGVILWMGHDCYPCPANTSILDFNGDPKLAALALREIWRGSA